MKKNKKPCAFCKEPLEKDAKGLLHDKCFKKAKRIAQKNTDQLNANAKKEIRIDMSEFAGDYNLQEVEVVIKKMKKKVKDAVAKQKK